MAGDWLKMEVATLDKPEVFAIAAKMGWDEPDFAVGKLFRVWAWFDKHTTDGNARGVTREHIDRRIALTPGFAAAMESVGWLSISDTGATCTNFDYHCGATAKERAQLAKRVAKSKAKAKADRTDDAKTFPDDNATGNGIGNAHAVTEPLLSPLPREEKKREKKTEKGVTFSAWLKSLPPDENAIPEDHHVWAYAERVGLPVEFIDLAWLKFEAKHENNPKKYTDWRQAFRNAVEDNWYGLWFPVEGGGYKLTTKGTQAQRDREAGQ